MDGGIKWFDTKSKLNSCLTTEAFTIPTYRKYLTKDDLKDVVAAKKFDATNVEVNKLKDCNENCQEINGVYKCFDLNNIENSYCISNDSIKKYNDSTDGIDSFYKLLQDDYGTYLTLEDKEENILKVIHELQSFIQIINDKVTNKNLKQNQKDKIDNVYNYWKKNYNTHGVKFEPSEIFKTKLSNINIKTEKLLKNLYELISEYKFDIEHPDINCGTLTKEKCLINYTCIYRSSDNECENIKQEKGTVPVLRIKNTVVHSYNPVHGGERGYQGPSIYKAQDPVPVRIVPITAVELAK